MVPDDRLETIAVLEQHANRIRRLAVQAVYDGGSGHCGGSLSVADILAVLFFHVLRIRPEEPLWPDRDRFVLSKGHACPALSAVLAEKGFFDHAELKGLRKAGSLLQGHPEYGIPGVETPTGSLGQGFSSALGMALGLRLAGRDSRVYVVLGDGETQEGQVWEAAMAAAHHKLDHLTAFVDKNGLQGDGCVAEILDYEPFADKWRAFGWAVREIDGHDIGAILDAVEWAHGVGGQPQVVIADTVKGKGVSFMEGVAAWHGTAPPTDDELATALSELERAAEGE